MTKIYDLSSTWDFVLDEARKGLDEHYETKPELFTDTISLPGTTSEQKKGKLNDARETGYLTELYKMEGYAWFRRSLPAKRSELIGKHIYLTLERTRISYVFIDHIFVGSCNSLTCSHEYDLTDAIMSSTRCCKDESMASDSYPVLTIMVSNVDYPTGGGHMTSPDTQTNWNGILGEMSLKVYDDIRIRHIRTEVDYSDRKLMLSLEAECFDQDRKAEGFTQVCKTEATARECKEPSITVPVTIFATPVTASEFEGVTDYNIRTFTPKNESVTLLSDSATLSSGAGTLNYTLALPSSLPDWDEYDPSVILLTTTLGDDEYRCWFGIREFKAENMHFYINGRKTFLRGKHDGMIFPLTGYAPMHVGGWLRHLSISKSYGINHLRFHTCCPPEAAFLAADLLGVYLQPEIPFWGSFYAETDAEYEEHRASQEYLTHEGFGFMKEFGNHPSFALMSMGNELWGSPEAVGRLVAGYKKIDTRHLYTQGSNNFQWVPNIQPSEDFFSGVRFTKERQIRGSYAQCDAPLGHVQTAKPGTVYNYEEAIFPSYSSASASADADGMVEIQYGTGVKKVKLTDIEGELIPKIPVVSHEIGQYETYPDFNEINKYTGVLRARNFEIFKERLEKAGLLDLANDYFRNSGTLAMQCYKEELEAALRTPDMAGFQILDIQDFSGQGTALVGVLDAFMDSKGLISDSHWRRFCSDAVIQAHFDSYVMKAGATIDVEFGITWYRKDLPGDVKVRIFLEDMKSSCPASCDDLACRTPISVLSSSVTEHGYTLLGGMSLGIPKVDVPSVYTLTVNLEGTNVTNQYELWIYPENDSASATSSAIVHTPKEALENAQAGRPSLLLLSPEDNPNSIEGTYATDFWCYPMFRGISEWMKRKIPVGTMGLLIDSQSPLLGEFPSHTYTTPQWFDIVMNSRVTILDGKEIRPVVQMIDNFERNHTLGLIYIVRIEGANEPIIVCTSPLDKLSISGSIESGALLSSLLAYMDVLSKNASANKEEAAISSKSAANAQMLSKEAFLNLFTASEETNSK